MKKKNSLRARLGLYATMLGLTLGLYAILIFALTLPFNSMLNNVVLQDSIWANILLILIDLVEILAYASGASLLAFAAFRPFSTATVLRLAGIYAATTFLRFVMELVGAWILYGTRHFLYNILEPTLINQLPFLCLDLLFVGAATALALSFANRYYQKKAVLTKASVLFHSDAETRPALTELYPFQVLVSVKNPLQLCTLILACVLVIANVISNLLFDVEYLTMAASVTFTDVLSMVGSYAYSVLIGVIFYSVCVLIFHLLFRQQDKLTK